MGYPPVRRKLLPRSSGVVDCGFLPLLQSFQKLQPGIEFELTFVVNKMSKPIGQVDEASGDRLWSEDEYRGLEERFSFVKEVVFRPNQAGDIGGYDFGYRLLRGRGFSGDVLFVNSSVAGPRDHGWLRKYYDLFRLRADTGLCGTTVNMIPQHGYATLHHVQSWFLYSNMHVLGKVFGERLLNDPDMLKSKQDIILHGEIAISQTILKAGYSICCSAFPELSYRLGERWEYPFRLGWRTDAKLIHLANVIL